MSSPVDPAVAAAGPSPSEPAGGPRAHPVYTQSMRAIAADPRVSDILGSLELPPRLTPAEVFQRAFDETATLLKSAETDGTFDIVCSAGCRGPVDESIRAARLQAVVLRAELGKATAVAPPPELPGKPQPVPVSDLEMNRRAAAYLTEHAADPDAVTVIAVADAAGVSKSRMGRSPLWRAFSERRQEARSGEVRVRELTDGLLAVLSDRAADDPADLAAARELADMYETERLEFFEEAARDQERERQLDEAVRPRRRR